MSVYEYKVVTIACGQSRNGRNVQIADLSSEMCQNLNAYAAMGWEYVRTDNVNEPGTRLFQWRERRSTVIVLRREIRAPDQQVSTPQPAMAHRADARPYLQLVHSNAG